MLSGAIGFIIAPSNRRAMVRTEDRAPWQQDPLSEERCLHGWRAGLSGATGGSSSRSAARSELVAGCRTADRSPYQPAPAQRERRKHVLTTVAPHLGDRRGSVSRLFLRQAPDPHRRPTSFKVPSYRRHGCGGCEPSSAAFDDRGLRHHAAGRSPSSTSRIRLRARSRLGGSLSRLACTSRRRSESEAA